MIDGAVLDEVTTSLRPRLCRCEIVGVAVSLAPGAGNYPQQVQNAELAVPEGGRG